MDNFDFFDSLEAATKWLENQSKQTCMAEAMQQLNEILGKANTFIESHK
jgi:hypothetical protein